MSNKKVIRNVLVVGATSSLAKPLCVLMAQRGWNLVLAGRDSEELERMKGDMSIRYTAKVECCSCDLTDPHFSGAQLLADATNYFEIDLLLIIAGEMGDPKLRADDFEIDRVIRTNYLSPIKVMANFAEKIEARLSGDIIVIGSVAGDRGRQSNYTYGSAKGALALYAAGLRNRLADKKCHVMTVKPGFVDTPMTYNVNSGLIAPREKIAEMILKAFDARKNEVYLPAIWGLIMLIIRNIPESIFKKMKL
jgi:short-subunit dehydrogenase